MAKSDNSAKFERWHKAFEKLIDKCDEEDMNRWFSPFYLYCIVKHKINTKEYKELIDWVWENDIEDYE